MKYPLSTAAFFIAATSLPANAQVSLTWARIFNALPSQSDQVNDLAVDASGNACVTGTSFNQTTGFPPLPPTRDIETVKYDAAGNQLWSARYQSPLGGDDLGYAVAIMPGGEVVVAGQSSGGAPFVSQQTVIKYDALGAVVWAYQYGPTAGPNIARALLVAANGDIFVGGNDGGGNASGDMCVRKLDANGIVQWTATYDGVALGYDYVYALAFAPNGDIVAAGNTANTTDLALMRVSPTGTVLWAREVSAAASGSETAFSVAVDAAGNVYAAGQLTPGANGTDQALVAYDAVGTHLWTRTRNGSANAGDALLKVAIDPLGRAVAAGRLAETGAGANFSTVVYDAAGNLAWSREWGGAANLDDLARGLVLDAAGNVYVAGSSPLATVNEGRVVAYDANGADLFNFPYGNGVNAERFIDIEKGPGGSFYVGGYHDQGIANGLDYLTVRLDPTSISFCSGDGSGTACPCGNNGVAGRGCASSAFAGGGRLTAVGTPGASAATDTLVLTALDIPGPGLFFQGTGQFAGGAGVMFGDGLLCAGGAITRLGVVFPAGGSASYPGGLTPNPIHVAGAPIAAGDVRHYQVWYRDAAVFCTVSTFNLTQGVTITWVP
jgi:hypothetical protein